MNELMESGLLSIMSEQSDKLRVENQQLKDRIDKVIDYVETKLRDVNLQYGIDNEFRQEYDELLGMLKDKNDE